MAERSIDCSSQWSTTRASRRSRHPHARGFSLIELMIALAIIAIAASIAIPSYQGHVQKARRREAQTALLGLASAMERRFTLANTYLGAASGGANTGPPAIYPTQAPLDGTEKYYNLTIQAATASSYTLHATPLTGSPQAGDACATLTLTSTGVRGTTGTATGCWTH